MKQYEHYRIAIIYLHIYFRFKLNNHLIEAKHRTLVVHMCFEWTEVGSRRRTSQCGTPLVACMYQLAAGDMRGEGRGRDARSIGKARSDRRQFIADVVE